MNTKQIEELKKKYPLIEVPNIDWVRQQTAKEIIEMIEKDESDYDFGDDYSIAKYNMVKLIKSKYGIGEK